MKKNYQAPVAEIVCPNPDAIMDDGIEIPVVSGETTDGAAKESPITIWDDEDNTKTNIDNTLLK